MKIQLDVNGHGLSHVLGSDGCAIAVFNFRVLLGFTTGR